TCPPRLRIQSATSRSCVNVISARSGSARQPTIRLPATGFCITTLWASPLEACTQLRRPGRAARIARRQNSRAGDRRRVVRVVENIEKINVEPEHRAFFDFDEFKRGGVLEPQPG